MNLLSSETDRQRNFLTPQIFMFRYYFWPLRIVNGPRVLKIQFFKPI